jgi:hypothetical protein
MTDQEEKTLRFLAHVRERIESGAVRIIEADVSAGLGDCLVMRLPPEKNSYSVVSTIRMVLEPVPADKRVPLQIKNNV